MNVSNNPLYQPKVLSNPLSIESATADDTKTGLLSDPKVEMSLKQFCDDNCPGVSVKQMEKWISAGEELGKKIADCPNGEAAQQLASQLSNKPEAVKNLMWLLTAQTANYDQLFTSGSIRLDDPGGKVEAFIKECGKGEVYPRISSHMKENVEKGKPQLGFDLHGLGLPSGKQTLLFAKQADGTLFLKMEEHGCPPFWKKGFQNISNFHEYAMHSLQFIKTRFKKGSTSSLKARKEHVPKNAQKAFAKLMNIIAGDSQDTKALIKEGQKKGLSHMNEILKEKVVVNDDASKSKTNSDLINEFRDGYLKSLDEATARKYEGNVKGNEVVLPALGT